jgi:tetratricopeptide (TPR) repeat protein
MDPRSTITSKPAPTASKAASKAGAGIALGVFLFTSCSDAGEAHPRQGATSERPAGDASNLDPVRPPQVAGMDPELASLVQTFVERVEASPSDPEAHGELGLVYEANSMSHEAEQCYEKAALLQPESARWRYRQGIVQRTAGKLEEALVNMRRAYEKAPEVKLILIRLGEMLLDDGKLAEARKICEEAVKHGGDSPESWLGLANVHLAEGNPEKTVELCEKALEMDPSYQAAHYSLGLAYRAQGRTEDALRELRVGEGALRRYPQDQFDLRLRDYGVGYGRRMGRIEVMAQSGQAKEAVLELEKILQDRPEDPAVLGLMARTQLGLGQPHKALEYLQRSRRIGEVGYQLELDTCSAFYALQDIARATTHAQAAVDLAPRIGRTHFVLGACRLASQDVEGAYQSLTMAHRNGFKVAELYLQLAQVCGMTNRAEEMAKYSDIAIEMAPDNSHAYILGVQAHLMLGQVSQARAELERAKAIAPQDEEVQRAEQAVRQMEGQ